MAMAAECGTAGGGFPTAPIKPPSGPNDSLLSIENAKHLLDDAENTIGGPSTVRQTGRDVRPPARLFVAYPLFAL